MSLKYEITPNYITIFKLPLFRIRALRDIPSAGVKAGDLGGYIENEENLSQEGRCWIGGEACVYCKSYVFGDAQVYGNAHVFDHAQIYGNAQVFENATVYNCALVFGNASIFDKGSVFGNVQVFGNAIVCGNIVVKGSEGKLDVNESMILSGYKCITSLNQLYYADGVTIFFDITSNLIVNGSSLNKEHHITFARLKLS